VQSKRSRSHTPGSDEEYQPGADEVEEAADAVDAVDAAVEAESIQVWRGGGGTERKRGREREGGSGGKEAEGV
jgi:hypothetical protein